LGGHVGVNSHGWNAGVSAGADGVYGKIGGGESDGHAYGSFGGGVKYGAGGADVSAGVDEKFEGGHFQKPEWNAGYNVGGFGDSVSGSFEMLDAEEGEEGAEGEEGVEAGEAEEGEEGGEDRLWEIGHSFDVGGYDLGGHVGVNSHGWNAGVSAGADGVYGKIGGGESDGHAYGSFGGGVKYGAGGADVSAGVDEKFEGGHFQKPEWNAGYNVGGFGDSVSGSFE